ncbi:iron complex outermembrane recepter protein [Dyella sp. OK004]|uniref:TonB-dependent copper receptor n=1 Tax=Dyella sp. OK004 TaxID=1855292 RepID=UPI0008F22E92|nr:TonB-dependent copper receptor [Dyella sp. OK004]SFS16487.1 iron complex outermembrane recepter protein [Dyella sp. OK004]
MAVIATLALAPRYARAEDDTETLPPVVVTAPMQTSPLTVVTNPKAPRQPVPASDGADFLKSIPGFSSIRKGGSNGDPVLRGMAGSRLNLLIDGGQIGGGCPSRMDPPTAYISPQLFDRVTVIKGPQTVLYGPGNSAGTVLFEREFTRYTAPAASFEGSLLGGSWGRNDQMADLRAGNPTGYLGISANHTHAQDYEDGDGRRVHSSYDRWNADATLGWTPDDDTRLELTAGKGDGKAAYAFSGMDGAQFLRESAGLKFERRHLSTVFDKLEAQVYYNYADHVMDNYTLRKPDPTGMMPMAMASDVDRRTVGGRLAGTFVWGDALQLTTGLDGSSNVHTARNGGPPGSPMGYYRDLPRARDARIRTIGAFGEMRWSFAERQRLISGVRVDRAQVRGYGLALPGGSSMGHMGMSPAATTVDAGRSSTLPAGFLRYERDLATSPMTLYAGIGHVERYPDYWELFGQHASKTLSAFSSLRPEKTTQLDVGLQYNDRRLKAWVSAYAGVVNDFILLHYGSGMMASSHATNVDARIAGGEAGLAYSLSDHWKTDATLAYAWGANRTEHRALPQMPPLEARFGLNYESGHWTAGALWRIAAAQKRVAVGEGNIIGQDLGPSRGFAVFSLNAAYRIDRRITLSAGIDNLFDKTYAEHINAATVGLVGYVNTVRINEPGRTGWLKLDLKY